jgi:hypothetical protein
MTGSAMTPFHKQTAKNVFLWPGRDWLRKGFEAWFTALIELAWGKRRIMEIYLNVAEWGPGVYGAEAAARHYFHKPAYGLNLEEAVRLAAVLPDPLDWSPRRSSRRLLARVGDPREPAGCPRGAVLALRGGKDVIGFSHRPVYRDGREGGRRAGESLSPRRDLCHSTGGPGVIKRSCSTCAHTRVGGGSQAADRLCAAGHH